MQTLRFDLSKRGGKFKRLNAVNSAPMHRRHATDQFRDNLEHYKALRIPYWRNNCASGVPYAHDYDKIFRNQDADVYDPASYDFVNTDESIFVGLEGGAKVFYQLAATIEHTVQKHGTLPPKDFHKWAVMCEQFIRHFNEGWADGQHFDIEYWEIWNEPDLDPLPATHRRTWGGTDEQFFDLYEITAKHLKKCFPHLKIGGPALAFRLDWAESFLSEMENRGVEIDFFSWHIYTVSPERIAEKTETIQALLEKHGYGDAENILNEWGYVKGWGEEIIYSYEMIRSIKGAAYTMAVMSLEQASSLDMLMYYSTMPSCWNGAFDYLSFRPLKTYYVLKWYGTLYDLEAEVACEDKKANLYTLCGVDCDGKATCIVTYYNDDDNAGDKEVKVDFSKSGKYDVYLLDEEHNADCIGEFTDLTFTMKRNSVLYIKEK